MPANRKMPYHCRISCRTGLLMSLIFLIILSCKSRKEPGVITINPLNLTEREVRLSDFTDDMTYIPVDNEILFQHPNRIETTEELFIMATFPTGVKVFDRKGKFRNRIGARGRGPGEYHTSGSDFTIDRNNGLIYILDRKNIIVYNFRGLFIKEFSIEEFDSYFTDIQFQDGKIYLAGFREMGFAKYDWLVIDTLGNLIAKKKNHVPGFLTGLGARGGFFLSNANLHYWNNYNDTIFVIHEDDHYPLIFIEQGDFREPTEDYPLEDFLKYFRIYNIIGSQKYLFLRYHYDHLFHEASVNIENGNLSLFGKSEISPFNYPGIINNLDGGPNFSPSFFYNDNNDNYLIGWVYAYRLKAHVESEAFRNSTPKYPEKKMKLEELAASLDENDNPVLMLVKLKN